ncbi:hypothetical protein BJX66DRAFT_99298 [Aspergillus keveii]|uniref:Uncharacterized protein n=1 Tax=Aspergillus keveii TaxID=714993 RepID=A0ABR4GNW6_9EURO
MHKLLPLALLVYSAAAAQEGPTTIETTIVDTFPTDPAVSSTIITEPSSAFDPEPSTESTIIADPTPADPTISSTIIADPSSAFDPENPTGSVTLGDPTFTPSPSAPSTTTSIIVHPSFPPWHAPQPTPTGGWTTSTIIADPTPGAPGAPEAPGSGGPSTTSTTIADPGFTGAAFALNAPLYAVAGVLAGAVML